MLGNLDHYLDTARKLENFSLGCIVNLFPFSKGDRLGPIHDGKRFEELSTS